MLRIRPCSKMSVAPAIGLFIVAAVCMPAAADQIDQAEAGRDQIQPITIGTPIEAVAVRIKGQVRAAPVGAKPTDADAWKPVQVGDTLTQGMQVMTGLGSELILRIGDEEPYTELKIGRQSLVSLDLLFKTAERKASLVTLGHGDVTIAVDVGGLESDFVVDTPVATLSKRGTEGLYFRYVPLVHEIEAGILETGSGLGYLYRKRDGRGQAFGRGQRTNLNLPPLTETLRRGRLVNFLDPSALRGWDVIFNFRQGNTGFGALVAAQGSGFLSEIGRLPSSQLVDQALGETEARLNNLLGAIDQPTQPIAANLLQNSLRTVQLLRQLALMRLLEQAGQEGSFGVRVPFDLPFLLDLLQGVNLPTGRQWNTQRGSMTTGRSPMQRWLVTRRPAWVFQAVQARMAARQGEVAKRFMPRPTRATGRGWRR